MTNSTSEVFISYSRADRESAVKLRDALVADGLRVWMDDELLGGDQWMQVIRTNIANARLLVLMLSAATEARPTQVTREVSLADKYGVPIFPVLLDQGPFSQFEFILSSTHFHETSGRPIDESLPTLVKHVHTQVERLRQADTSVPVPLLPTAPAVTVTQGKRVSLLYRRGAKVDEGVLNYLRTQLAERGYDVFCDRELLVGVEWFKHIEDKLRNSDAAIVLLSAQSVDSEMIQIELQIAHDERQKRGGSPLMLPVRLNFSGELPDPIRPFIEKLQYYPWQSEDDNPTLLTSLIRAIEKPVSAMGDAEKAQLTVPTGAVPLDSPFYVERPVDPIMHSALEKHESIILVKGARQMGKTSLIARGLNRARKNGMKVVITDLQKLNQKNLETLRSFYCSIGTMIADQLDLDVDIRADWRDDRSDNGNFENFLRRKIIKPLDKPFLWALDEVDRLFVGCDYSNDFFGLVRSWHNERADPDCVWSRMTVIIGYATEASLFISDLNMSPFNVGRHITMQDFSLEQIADLNVRYGSPLTSSTELEGFYALIGGQPYLARRGLHEMVVQGWNYERLAKDADRDEGVFGDHLRRFYILLCEDQEMMDAVRNLISGSKAPLSHHAFCRLRTAGLVRGESRDEATIRCGIYASYLKRHLV